MEDLAQTQGQQTDPQQVTQQHDPLDDLVDSIEANLDPDGHIPPNQEPRTQEPTQIASEPQPQPQDTELEPPQHWPEEKKELFRRQTPEAREFLLERHKAMEGDYTQKTQQLAQQAQAVAGLQGLGARLQQDPQFREHMQSYFQQQAGTSGQPESTAPANDGEVDPITAIEERAAQKAYDRIKQEQGVQARQAQAHDFENAWNIAQQTKNEDPLRGQVMAKLNDYVKAQKHPIRINETMQQLDQNPFFFNEMYRVMREDVVAEQQSQTDGQQVTTQRRTVAPTLERGGGAPITTSQATARKRRADMKNEALRSGTTEALGEFLDSAGLIDQLL